MGPLTAISTAFAKTFTYSGRASRSEYWWYSLFYFLVCLVCAFLDTMTMIGLVQEHGEQAFTLGALLTLKSLYACIILIPPFLSLSVRRLHDAGFSGFWMLICFVPVGGLVLLVMHIFPSTESTTVHGTPASKQRMDHKGKPLTPDAHHRAMQGYALLFEKDKRPSPETQAARKAEIADYYRNQVLKSAPNA